MYFFSFLAAGCCPKNSAKSNSPKKFPCPNLGVCSLPSARNGKKSRLITRKHVIVGVTCAVVIAMAITGVLVGVKFHLDSTSEIVTVYN